MRSVVVVLLLTLALGACTIEVVSSGEAPASPPRPTAASVAAAAPDDTVDAEAGAGDRETRADDERTAVEVSDRFWQGWFADQGRRYVRPRVAGGYVGSNGPSCAGQPSVPGNAYYCPAGNFLAWDENLMRAGYDQIGDAWVYLVIAHEWGHAIQAQLPGRLVAQAVELQADCLAGAALQGAADQGLVQIQEGDEQEIARALQAVADDFPWTDVTSHGNAQQRTSAFQAGVADGVDGCLRR
jgi:predicted metalloprotease